MPIVLPESRYRCTDPAAAQQMRDHLTRAEELDDVAVAPDDDHVVTVPDMDLGGALEIATLAADHGWMSDADAAAAIRWIETAPKAYV